MREREREREREKEAVVVVVSKVEGLKSSYHFFVVYLFVCFYEGEICFRTCLTSIYLVLLYNYYYY
jgi:hypothetical protein